MQESRKFITVLTAFILQIEIAPAPLLSYSPILVLIHFLGPLWVNLGPSRPIELAEAYSTVSKHSMLKEASGRGI